MNGNINSKPQAPNNKQSPSYKFQIPNIGLCGSDKRGRILGNRGLCGSDKRGRILGNRLNLEFWISLRLRRELSRTIGDLVIGVSYWRLIKSLIPKSAIE